MRILLISIVILITGIGNAWSAGDIALESPFNASAYTRDGLKFIQAGLKIKQFYRDSLDGFWSPASSKALAKYVLEELNENQPPSNADAMILVVSTVLEIREKGWKYRYISSIDKDILTPEPFEAIDNSEGEVRNYVIDDMDLVQATQTTRQMKQAHFQENSEFKAYNWLRNRKNWGTVGISRDKMAFSYSTRSGGSWNTITVSGESTDSGKIFLMLESLNPKGEYRFLPSDRFVALADQFLEDYEKEQVSKGEKPNEKQQANLSPQEDSQPEQETPKSGSGTAFAVTSDGHLLTNAHVVDGCEHLSVNGNDAKLLATEENFDLALLQIPGLHVKRVAIFADSPAPLNSDITTTGNPLAGLLGGLNITRGTVAARKGLGGRGIDMQITAPLQPGNSGGPAVNSSGQVVGVVVSGLNASAIADIIGDIPQNVNFAIRGTIAQLFLHQNGITPQKAEKSEALPPEDIASQLSEYTFQVNCNAGLGAE